MAEVRSPGRRAEGDCTVSGEVPDMEKPLVSVVMPAFQCADTIGQAIASVLVQNVPMELLIVDDCSSDHLEQAIAPFAGDHRIRVMRNERNLGAAESRNRAVAMARGAYIAYLDADDVWLPGKLEKQMRLLEQTGTVLCATARELMTPGGKPTGRTIPVRSRITYRALLLHNCINCSSVVVKTEVAREFPMEHDDSHEDYISWLRILEKYGEACAVNEPLLQYRLSRTGKSGRKLHSAAMTFRAYRYLGFGMGKCLFLFVCYAFCGLVKYLGSYLRRRYEN